MMMLQFEDVLFEVLVERQACGLGSHFGLCSLLLGHECRPGSGFCDLDACESGFLQSQKEKCHYSISIIICYAFLCITRKYPLRGYILGSEAPGITLMGPLELLT